MTPLHNLGLRFTGSSSSIRPEGDTAHYGGPSPWRGADRSSPARFRDTTDHARCPSIVRAWHDFHLSKGWFGFAYTSAVCPHGHRYEGRGAGKRTGANGTNTGNVRSYATVYIAGDDDPVTDEAKVAFLDEAARLGVPLRWDHSDWKATACAGPKVREWEAAGWPRPSSTPAPPPSEETDEMLPFLFRFKNRSEVYLVAGDLSSRFHVKARDELDGFQTLLEVKGASRDVCVVDPADNIGRALARIPLT